MTKNRKYKMQCNNMEASSDSIPPSNNQPLNVEPQVFACDQKISTRASHTEASSDDRIPPSNN